MSGLRVQSDVVAVARHVHVQILEQLGHLADEDVSPPLRLNEVKRAWETAAAPTIERGHAGRIPRVSATATASTASSGCAVGSPASSGAVNRPASSSCAVGASTSSAATAALRFGNARD